VTQWPHGPENADLSPVRHNIYCQRGSRHIGIDEWPNRDSSWITRHSEVMPVQKSVVGSQKLRWSLPPIAGGDGRTGKSSCSERSGAGAPVDALAELSWRDLGDRVCSRCRTRGLPGSDGFLVNRGRI
jgi:hypothetical protein